MKITNQKFVLATAVLCMCGAQAPRAMADLTIAGHGKSTFTVVIPGDAPTSAQAAAQELQKDVRLATGATLPIEKDTGKIAAPVISLGDTAQAKAAGINTNGLADGAFHLITQNGDLFIIGPDTPDGKLTHDGGGSDGTANGVYSFLEDYLGVRWLMPGSLGLDVPTKSIFTIGDLHRTFTPKFSWREMEHLWDFTDPEQGQTILQWTVHQRMVNNPEFDYGANWWRGINGGKVFHDDFDKIVRTTAVQQLYKEHPDWFAMDASGKRPYPKDHYAKLETTNPGLVRYFAELAIKTLKENPYQKYFSLSPSDGYGWSQSPESKALYDPTSTVSTDAAAPGGSPSMSSLVLKWYHDVAQIVEQEYPQGKLSGFIYSDYSNPPVKYPMKLPDNFTPVICGMGTYGYGLYRKENREHFQQVMNSWGKVAPATWYYYDLPNQLLRQDDNVIGSSWYYGGNFPGSTAIVTPAAPGILNTVFSTLLRNHIKGTYFEGGVPTWSNAALGNYLLAKLDWDPTLDARAVQRDWLNHAYGLKAGAVMEQFYDKLDQWMGDYAEASQTNCEILTLDLLKNVYAAHYGEMETLFLQAASQPMTTRENERLQLIGDNLIVLQWRLRNAGIWPASLTSQLQRSDAQIVALLTKDNPDFPLFPGLVPSGNYPYPKPPQWKVDFAASQPAQDSGSFSALDPNMFLIYATKDQTVRITPSQVTQGAYFASYQIYDANGKVLSWGVFTPGTPVEFPVKAGQPYYLYIPPRKPVNYVLDIEGAQAASGNLQNNTLTLSGNDGSLYIFYPPQNALVGLFEKAESIEIRKPFSGTAAVAYLQSGGYYKDVQVVDTFDDGWRFSPDPGDQLEQKDVTSADFDDSTWKTLSAMNWWQFQGFKDYHGSAWYRTTFSLDTAPPPDGLRAKLYFGSVDGNAEIYLNGKKVGEHTVGPAPDFRGWDAPFEMDVTYTLKKGENILAVNVVSKPDGASGITGGVSLVTAVQTDKK